MAPLPSSISPAAVPPPVPVATHPNRGALKPPTPQRPPSDPNRLAPEDAYYAHSPPRLRPLVEDRVAGPGVINNSSAAANAAVAALRPAAAALRPPPAIPVLGKKKRDKERGRSASRRRKGAHVWKKLLWVKQSYPDNYTDTETFLDHLQRNPRLRPYDFWPLVADSTVIVQHICSVVIFVCCFIAIFQKRVSPVSVVGWGSIGTVLGWGLWDYWVGQEEEEVAKAAELVAAGEDGVPDDGSSASSTASSFNPATSIIANGKEQGLGLTITTAPPGQHLPPGSAGGHSHSASATSLQSANSAPISPVSPSIHPNGALLFPHYFPSTSTTAHLLFSPRNQARLSTAKSAILIYCALLGLSPILKSLTESTSSDSIWAMTTWLLLINVFFFDYGSSTSSDEKRNTTRTIADGKFPASLSTNAALMASTVLASRLPSTTHVFSLTLFSIEVFGLFPVFRRHLRHISWNGHLLLTIVLVMAAGGGVGETLRRGWGGAILGIVVGALLTALVMGGCSWWLIGLQRYKNVVIGPWDVAKPVVRGGRGGYGVD